MVDMTFERESILNMDSSLDIGILTPIDTPLTKDFSIMESDDAMYRDGSLDGDTINPMLIDVPSLADEEFGNLFDSHWAKFVPLFGAEEEAEVHDTFGDKDRAQLETASFDKVIPVIDVIKAESVATPTESESDYSALPAKKPVRRSGHGRVNKRRSVAESSPKSAYKQPDQKRYDNALAQARCRQRKKDALDQAISECQIAQARAQKLEKILRELVGEKKFKSLLCD